MGLRRRHHRQRQRIWALSGALDDSRHQDRPPDRQRRDDRAHALCGGIHFRLHAADLLHQRLHHDAGLAYRRHLQLAGTLQRRCELRAYQHFRRRDRYTRQQPHTAQACRQRRPLLATDTDQQQRVRDDHTTAYASHRTGPTAATDYCYAERRGEECTDLGHNGAVLSNRPSYL